MAALSNLGNTRLDSIIPKADKVELPIIPVIDEVKLDEIPNVDKVEPQEMLKVDEVKLPTIPVVAEVKSEDEPSSYVIKRANEINESEKKQVKVPSFKGNYTVVSPPEPSSFKPSPTAPPNSPNALEQDEKQRYESFDQQPKSNPKSEPKPKPQSKSKPEQKSRSIRQPPMKFGPTSVGYVQNNVGKEQVDQKLLQNRNPATGIRASKIQNLQNYKYLKYKAKYLHLKKLFE